MLAALATDALTGAAAGAGALVLYAAAQLLSGREDWSGLLSAPSSIRLAAYVAAGATVGWFATRARGMLAESLHVLDELLAFARRDATTGLRARGAFERVLEQRASRRDPFALLIADAPPPEARDQDGAARRRARLVTGALPAGAELAQLGRGRYAAIVEAPSPPAARGAADRLERELHAAGLDVSVGWAFHPADGNGCLGLLAAGVERLQARRIVRGEWVPTAESAGLVDRLR